MRTRPHGLTIFPCPIPSITPTTASSPLPPVVPPVLYHGRELWRLERGLFGLFGQLDSALTPYIPDFRHEFCDLSLPEPEAVKGAALSKLCLLALKHVFDLAPKQILPLARDILSRETALEMLEVVLRYYVTATQRLDEGDVAELLTGTTDEATMQTFRAQVQADTDKPRQTRVQAAPNRMASSLLPE